MTITPDQLADWARITEAATEGPWRISSYECEGRLYCQVDAKDFCTADCAESDRSEPDATFIAAARSAMPALLDEVKRLRGQVIPTLPTDEDAERRFDEWLARRPKPPPRPIPQQEGLERLTAERNAARAEVESCDLAFDEVERERLSALARAEAAEKRAENAERVLDDVEGLEEINERGYDHRIATLEKRVKELNDKVRGQYERIDDLDRSLEESDDRITTLESALRRCVAINVSHHYARYEGDGDPGCYAGCPACVLDAARAALGSSDGFDNLKDCR